MQGVCLQRNATAHSKRHILRICTHRGKPTIDFHTTGDPRYTRFRYPRFSISAVLFQYHEKHQYPIRGHGKAAAQDH
jgi:hypothetical protein